MNVAVPSMTSSTSSASSTGYVFSCVNALTAVLPVAISPSSKVHWKVTFASLRSEPEQSSQLPISHESRYGSTMPA